MIDFLQLSYKGRFGLTIKHFQQRLALLVVLSATLPSSAFAAAPKVLETLPTVGGELKIIERENLQKYSITLGGKVVLETDSNNNKFADQVIPAIHTDYKSVSNPIGDFQEVVLLQLNGGGNACSGGPLMFLGIKSATSFSLSKPIDFCGGPQPVITWGANKVILHVPAGPPNRGDGIIPAETWVYEGGVVKKQATGAQNHKAPAGKH